MTLQSRWAVLDVPMPDTSLGRMRTSRAGVTLLEWAARPRLARHVGAAEAIVALRAAHGAIVEARTRAKQARERRAIMEALLASRVIGPREMRDAEREERDATARYFDAEVDLAEATMRAFAATGHIDRIAIRSLDS